MASEPYCAEAPSRRTSTCFRAIAGMTDMSAPCAPSETPLPCQTTSELRWRRLPLISTSVWSGAKPRRLAGRTSVEASLMGWVLTLKEGTTVLTRFCKSASPCLTISALLTTSTGTADSTTERGFAREPMTTNSSMITTWSRTDVVSALAERGVSCDAAGPYRMSMAAMPSTRDKKRYLCCIVISCDKSQFSYGHDYPSHSM